jgi:hypothetical protein
MSNNIFSAVKNIILLYCFVALVVALAFRELSIYIFPINVLIATILALSGRWIDARIGLLLFASLYYLGQFFNFFIIDLPDITSGLNNNVGFHLTDYYINIQALNYVVVFQLGLLVQLLINKLDFQNIYNYHKIKILTYDFFIAIKLVRLTLFLIFILLLSTLNWNEIGSKYTLEGMANIYFVYYLFISIMIMDFIYKGVYLRKSQYMFVIGVVFSLILFNYLGVRQVLFWSSMILFVSVSIFLHIYKGSSLSIAKNKKYFIFGIFLFSFFLMLLNIGFLFRHQKTEMVNVLMGVTFLDLLNAIVSAFFAETKLTTYNLLAVVDENTRGNYLSFFNMLRDLLVMLVPSGLWAEKYEYLETVRFAKEYNVTPFGTWYIVGELVSSVVYPIYVFIASYIYSIFLYIFSSQIFHRSRSLIVASIFYGIAYVFLGLYVVRGTLSGGFKIAVSLLFGIVVLNFLLKQIRQVLIKNSV